MFPASPSARALVALGQKLLGDKQAAATASATAPASGGLKLMWQRLFREATAATAV
jgi:hypothetical protein